MRAQAKAEGRPAPRAEHWLAGLSRSVNPKGRSAPDPGRSTPYLFTDQAGL